MKDIELILIAMGLTFLLSCNSRNANSQSITIKKTDSKFEFKASFPERKTSKVVSYIEKALDENKLFSDSLAVTNADFNLGDTTKFHLKSQPGMLEITFRKIDNSKIGYQQLEKMCLGIKEELR
jgi:hypothetical protein